MDNASKSWVEIMCGRLVEIERETLVHLGENTGGFFISVGNDCIDINSAIQKGSSGPLTLVWLNSLSLVKEVGWFHFLFVSGNYPFLLGRLRFVWESVFRAYFAEHYECFLRGNQKLGSPSDSSWEAKQEWLDKHEYQLNWSCCIEPVLRKILALANREQEIGDYKDRWDRLNKYVHPSVDLAKRMRAGSLNVIDDFDPQWALQTVEMARAVFDVVWLAVLDHHPRALKQLGALGVYYPRLRNVIERVSSSV